MKMAHITIKTAKLEESVDFYHDVLGLEIVEDFRKNPGMGLPIVFLANTKGDTAIELIENPTEFCVCTGLSIGFHADDVAAKRAELWGQGIEVSPMISPTPTTKFFFITDPNGVSIQII